ncbi:MAG: helix-turn-helix domain-containing protein [Syntrophotalea acetylenica]|nr:helix-turn-helix domain-containing protein [Syntrophotalea acetylenica]
MDPERIRNIRAKLNLSQGDFATVLGVTQSTIARYESGGGKAAGDAERRLAQLDSLLQDEKQAKIIKDLLSSPGGIAGAAAILAAGSALFNMKALANLGGVGLWAVLGGVTGAALFKLLEPYHSKDDEGEETNQS